MQNDDCEPKREDVDDLAVIAERRGEATIPHDELPNRLHRNRILSELDADTGV